MHQRCTCLTTERRNTQQACPGTRAPGYLAHTWRFRVPWAAAIGHLRGAALALGLQGIPLLGRPVRSGLRVRQRLGQALHLGPQPLHLPTRLQPCGLLPSARCSGRYQRQMITCTALHGRVVLCMHGNAQQSKCSALHAWYAKEQNRAGCTCSAEFSRLSKALPLLGSSPGCAVSVATCSCSSAARSASRRACALAACKQPPH